MGTADIITRISLPGAIRRCAGVSDLFVVEDVQGEPMAYTHDIHLARLYFATPGMLNAMERFARVCQQLSGLDVDPEVKQEATGILEDVNQAFQAAIRVEVGG
ncbi:MAG: hypothetical protein H7835_09405 [Magnetococcus sp. XQGC-1]